MRNRIGDRRRGHHRETGRGKVTAGQTQCPGEVSVGIAEDGVSEDRAVSIGLNWATRSLVAWTGAEVSPEGPATHPLSGCESFMAAPVGTEWRWLLAGLPDISRLQAQPAPRWATTQLCGRGQVPRCGFQSVSPLTPHPPCLSPSPSPSEIPLPPEAPTSFSHRRALFRLQLQG